MSTKKNKNNSLFFIFAFFIVFLFSSFWGFIAITEYKKTQDDSVEKYYSHMTNICYEASNSYECYKLQFSKPIKDSAQNKNIIKRNKKALKKLTEHKNNFDNCFFKNRLKEIKNECLIYGLLFKDDITNQKTIEYIKNYISDNPYKSRNIVRQAFN